MDAKDWTWGVQSDAMSGAAHFAEAHWFGCAYVITSVDGDKTAGTAQITNSFLLTGTSEDDKAFIQQPIENT